MNATASTTVGEVVSRDYRAAAVFQRYGIDFCCGGHRSVEDACRSRNVASAEVLTDVEQACSTPDGAPQFASWDGPALIGYIVSTHHAYVRQALPIISAHTQKLAKIHGANHPELLQVEQLFAGVAAEMTSHMFKEEQILFPFINLMAAAAQQGRPAPPCPFGTVGNPIRMMEQEHESAGGALARIRELTAGYLPPDDACTTYRVGLKELEAFEDDLHAHVHLENNILFPKALGLEHSL